MDDPDHEFLSPAQPLTRRELEVLIRIGDGLTNREIAEQMTVAMSTVKWYVRQIYNKLGVNSRPEAILRARELDLLPGDEDAKGRRHRLPHQLTPFVGRVKELQDLATLLGNPAIRLVNIQGPGGIGKTRLAIEAVRANSDDFVDGVYFVQLAALDDPNLIASRIAHAIDSSFQIRDRGEKDPFKKKLLAHLHDKRTMLLLDNLEQLTERLELIGDILHIAPGVKIVTTSRERLRLLGETVYALDRMHVPENSASELPLAVELNDALQLFISCAERTQPMFKLSPLNLNAAINICQLVDGLPLGIELAAAWVGLLPLEEIAAEIKSNLDFLATNFQNIPERQRSIRSVFESTFHRLNDSEQKVFQQLTVFRGGFTRSGAENVAGARLNILLSLVDKSLIKPDFVGRYHIHELLRQYGWEKLAAAGQIEPVKDRHLEFFLRIASESEPHLTGSEQVSFSNQLDIEHDNMRAALAWAVTAEDMAESGLLLAGLLAPFWASRGYAHEGREHLSAALSRPQASQRTAARAKALRMAGLLAYLQGDYPVTRDLLEESLSIYGELGPTGRRGLADALITLGDMETELGDYALAATLIEEALDIMRELDDERGIARAYWQLGQCAVRPGHYEHAVFYFNQALPLLRKLGDTGHTAIALSGLAEVALRQGNFNRASTLEEESLALRRDIDETWGIAVSLGNFAWIALAQDELEQSVDLLIESMTFRQKIGDIGGFAWCLEKLAKIALLCGRRQSDSERDDEFQRAVRLLGFADSLRRPVNSKIDLVDVPEYERQLAFLHDQLDQATYATAWAEGQLMTLVQAIDYAPKV